MMLQKDCVIAPKTEKVGIGNGGIKNRKDRYGAGLGRVYCGM